MKVFVILAAVLVAAQAVSYFDVVQEQWSTFKVAHSKDYENETEERFRMKIYMDNMRKIAVHNQNYEKGLVSYKLDMNQYGDMLHHEFVRTVNGFNKSSHGASQTVLGDKYGYDGVKYIAPANVELPATVDWRTQGAVTPVKNQGHCGSCWSFSATGSLEGQHFRKSKKLVSLSEQNLVDCSEKYGNNGCEGGLMDNAFKYIKDNHGIDTESSYPYTAADGKCHYNPRTSGATDRGYVDVESGNEDELKAAIATVGPISVAIDASHESFQFYSNGVYNEPECDSEQLDHGVLAVGYGTSEQGEDYWLVKNSWGTTWGDEGYIKMTRNKDNQCGIATQASYPLV